jgi:hypothetical protein
MKRVVLEINGTLELPEGWEMDVRWRGSTAEVSIRDEQGRTVVPPGAWSVAVREATVYDPA